MNTLETYQKLITSEHRDKPKFMATVDISAKFYVHLQNVMFSFIEKFDLDSATGKQLDIIGEWVGASRFIDSPLTGVYFEWSGAASVGWSFGVWQSEFSPTSGLTSLPDDIYRTLIRGKIAANRWDGTIPSAYDIWESVFPNNTLVIQDNQNMTMTIAVVGEVLDTLTKQLILGGYIPLKPEGVGVEFYAIPVDTNPLFVWGASGLPGLPTAGWGEGSWSQLLKPT